MRHFACNMLRNALATSLAGCLLLVTTSCGWHLRGTDATLTDIESVSITAQDKRSELVTRLRHTLDAQNIAVTQGDAQYDIVILDQQTTRRTGSVSGSARTAEFRLITEVTYVIQPTNANHQTLIPPRTISAERFFDFDENRVLASENEQALLRQAINDNLIRQITTHLQNVAQQHTAANQGQ